MGEISGWILGMLFFTVVVSGGIYAINAGGTILGSGITYSNQNTQYNETVQLVSDIQRTIQDSTVSVSSLTLLGALSGAWNAISLFFKTGILINNVFNLILTNLGIPSFLISVVQAALLTTIVFTIFSIVMGRGSKP